MEYEKDLLDTCKSAILQINKDLNAYDALLDDIADARLVLLGESTHGTHEFYDIRSYITKRLIVEKGFNVIAIEGDFPDVHEVNRYIHQEKYNNAQDSLASFDRFPTWMWRNVDMIQLIDWLAHYNKKQQKEKKVSCYGLDLYSLYRSIDVIISFLDKINPILAQQARFYYGCFDHYNRDPQHYGYAVFQDVSKSCRDEAIQMLTVLQEQDWKALQGEKVSLTQIFYLEQNARVIKNAENYYRSLFIDDAVNWNIRDSHMMETVNELIKFYQLQGIDKPKLVVWAHNSHIGNAKFTQMTERGEYNIGQLAKEEFGKLAYAVGFSTYHGTVSAASDWHGHVERKIVRNGLLGSYEHFFHTLNVPQFLLLLKDNSVVPYRLLERAIGVIYLPRTERMSHYFYAKMAEQFDAVIHIDKTHAVEPLEKTSEWIKGEVPETYPTGL